MIPDIDSKCPDFNEVRAFSVNPNYSHITSFLHNQYVGSA